MNRPVFQAGVVTFSTHVDLALKKVESAVAGLRGEHAKRSMGEIAAMLYIYLHPLRARVNELQLFIEEQSRKDNSDNRVGEAG